MQRILLPFAKLGSKFSNWILVPEVHPLCDSNLNNRIYIHASLPFNRKPPVSIGNLHKNFLENGIGISENSEPTFIRTLTNAKVFRSRGFLIDENNKFLYDSECKYSLQNEFPEKFFITKPKKVRGTSLLIAGSFASHNYFHWLTDAIPKIAIAQENSISISEVDNVIVSNNELAFQNETLAILKIDPQKIVSLEKYNLLVCEFIIAPSATCVSGNVSKWIVDYLQDLFKDWMVVKNELPKKIYISRQNSLKRRLTNENRITEYLIEQGYDVVYLEKLSVKQQIQLFYNANSIIGVDGAGLTNLIFSSPKTSIIELFPSTYVNQRYWTISSHKNLKYGHLVGIEEDITDYENHLIDSNFCIDVEDLKLLESKMKQN